jgi:hypothetical protein
VLTRFAAQNLYAPLRTVEPLPGVMRVNLRRDLDLDTLMPTLPVRAVALASWRLEDQWVTAVRLTNTGARWVTLDPRVLQGDFLTATFQHEALGPRGTPEDTTVLYLVTRGRGLAQSLLPAIHRFDPAVHLPQPKTATRTPRRPAMRSNGLLKWLMIPSPCWCCSSASGCSRVAARRRHPPRMPAPSSRPRK